MIESSSAVGVPPSFMTYCVAIKINKGLIFCSDSRTNAGPDHVNTYSKLHRFSVAGERQVMIMTAGNLATSQAVISQIERDLKDDAEFNIHKADYLYEVADYIGQISLEQQNKYSSAGPNAGFTAEATFILGGQIKGVEMELYMIYPEGNHIKASEQHPFLQIGETKYGKPILDRIIRADTEPETAMRCALVSLDSTMRSNATVGPPIELVFYQDNQLAEAAQYLKFDENDPYLVTLRKSWDDNIRLAFDQLPGLRHQFEDS